MAARAPKRRLRAGRAPSPTPRAKRWPFVTTLALAGIALGALGVLAVSMSPGGSPAARPVASIPVSAPSAAETAPPTAAASDPVPTTFAELMAWPKDRLGELDIALVNLLCAEGLPGSEDLDIEQTLKTLDLWAAAVKGTTERQLYMFRNDPADYENAEPYFRMLVLVTVLQLDLGVHYNMERVRDPDFGNSKDQFIHGMVNCENGGTCVSMPVLYVAVARRLGYPLKLVLAHDHVFCRWDDGQGTVKNFDGASRGLHSDPDEHYGQWPRPITDEELEHREFLVSLTPEEELATFLAARGHCFADNRRWQEAREMYVAAAELFPSSTACQYFVALADAALRPPIRVQPGARGNQLGMPTIVHPRDQRRPPP